ncbi:MAG: SIS domain-containing protein, partial [Caulobacteraceae bacterium]|nr:SIS domain-containing protein [Caulobacter sp.]
MSPAAKADNGATHEHRTLSEIYEQPRAIEETLAAYVSGDTLNPSAWAPVRDVLKGGNGAIDRLIIAASGTSRHAGLTGEIMIEEASGVAVDVEYASEYPYRRYDSLRAPAVLVLSQSGETADTLAALREAHSRGARTISITNVEGSTMAREADATLLTRAGKEVAIAATKSFTTQLVLLQLISLLLGRERGRATAADVSAALGQLASIPSTLARVLPSWEAAVAAIAPNFASADAFLFLGRALHYPIAREGALKLKEVSYIHAEAYPTGELKHGPNALLGEGAPLVVIATRDQTDPSSMLRYRKSVQLLEDIRKQGVKPFVLATEGDTEIPTLAQNVVFIPPTPETLLPILE